MPIYEYQCSGCEERFEELIGSVDDEAAVECPGCGSTKVFRVLSSFAVGGNGSCEHRQGPAHTCAMGRGGGFTGSS